MCVCVCVYVCVCVRRPLKHTNKVTHNRLFCFYKEDRRKRLEMQVPKTMIRVFCFVFISASTYHPLLWCQSLLIHYSFGAAFLASSICIALAIIAFVSKRKAYRHHVPNRDGEGTIAKTTWLCLWLIRRRVLFKFAELCLSQPLRSPLTQQDLLTFKIRRQLVGQIVANERGGGKSRVVRAVFVDCAIVCRVIRKLELTEIN